MIELLDNWFICSDGLYNFILQKRTESFDKNGNPIFINKTYHGSLVQALKAYQIKMELSEFTEIDGLTLKDAVDKLITSNNQILELLNDKKFQEGLSFLKDKPQKEEEINE